MSITDISTSDIEIIAAVNGHDLATEPGSATEGKCPSWCTGRHTEDGCHLAAICPAWCEGHPGCEKEMESWGPQGVLHAGSRVHVTLSLAEPYEAESPAGMHPDYIETSVWKMADAAAPVVAVGHRAENYLPDMTPAEAMALAADLVRAAGTAAGELPAHTGTSCPSWCEYGPCGPHDLPHISWTPAAPVIEHKPCRHMMDYAAGRMAAPCEEDNCAELMLGEDGVSRVGLRHGNDCLPEMTLDAAAAFALGILELVNAGREPSPEG